MLTSMYVLGGVVDSDFREEIWSAALCLVGTMTIHFITYWAGVSDLAQELSLDHLEINGVLSILSSLH